MRCRCHSVRRVVAGAGIARLNLAAGLQLVLAVSDHHVPGIESAGNDRGVPLRQRNCHGARLDGLIRLDRINKCSLRTAQDRGRGHHCAVLARFKQQVRVDELVGPKLVVFVVEDRFQLRRSRRWIDLVIDGLQFARRQLGLIVAAVSFHRSVEFFMCCATVGN